jgi:hypothetical protein
MDQEECYRWGSLFAGDRTSRVSGMAKRATVLGLTQAEDEDVLIWRKDQVEFCRWVFIGDPADVESIRRVYASDENINSPCCYVVVRQLDPSDARGDIIFDIFRLNPQSFLWHFNRVYTRPEMKAGA